MNLIFFFFFEFIYVNFFSSFFSQQIPLPARYSSETLRQIYNLFQARWTEVYAEYLHEVRPLSVVVTEDLELPPGQSRFSALSPTSPHPTDACVKVRSPDQLSPGTTTRISHESSPTKLHSAPGSSHSSTSKNTGSTSALPEPVFVVDQVEVQVEVLLGVLVDWINSDMADLAVRLRNCSR